MAFRKMRASPSRSVWLLISLLGLALLLASFFSVILPFVNQTASITSVRNALTEPDLVNGATYVSGNALEIIGRENATIVLKLAPAADSELVQLNEPLRGCLDAVCSAGPTWAPAASLSYFITPDLKKVDPNGKSDNWICASKTDLKSTNYSFLCVSQKDRLLFFNLISS